MTTAQFLLRYPEFGGQETTDRVDAALADAALSVSPSVFGALYDVAHGHYAAHLMTSGAAGQDARVQWDTQESIHWRNFLKVRRQVVIGLGVS